MSQNSHLPARELQVQQTIIEVETPALQMPAPTAEQARVVDQVFAVPAAERNSLVDAVNFAAVGMLLHDLVADTLAPPANEDEEEEMPSVEPREPE